MLTRACKGERKGSEEECSGREEGGGMEGSGGSPSSQPPDAGWSSIGGSEEEGVEAGNLSVEMSVESVGLGLVAGESSSEGEPGGEEDDEGVEPPVEDDEEDEVVEDEVSVNLREVCSPIRARSHAPPRTHVLARSRGGETLPCLGAGNGIPSSPFRLMIVCCGMSFPARPSLHLVAAERPPHRVGPRDAGARLRQSDRSHAGARVGYRRP